MPALTLSPSTLTAAAVAAKYTQAITATGGTKPYHFTVASGSSLPAGLHLSATGTLSGTPTAAGPFNFTVTATDSAATPDTGSQKYTLTVNAAKITLSPTTLVAPQVASPYGQTVRASGGTTPYHYSVSSGSLPQGLTLNATTGRISGTPRAQGTFKFTVKATDSSTGTGAPFLASQSYTLTVRQGRPSQAAFAVALSSVPLNGALPMFQVQVQDALHDPLQGVVVNLRLVTIGAVGPAGFGAGSVVRAVTGANGIATFTGITITTRGVYEIEADAGLARALSNVFEVGLNGRHSPP